MLASVLESPLLTVGKLVFLRFSLCFINWNEVACKDLNLLAVRVGIIQGESEETLDNLDII